MINSVSEPTRLAEVRRETAMKILSEPPAVPPGTAFAYSNEGFMLASLIAEEASGQSWENLMQSHFADPLGLQSLGFGAPKGDNVPFGHRRVGPFKLMFDPAEGGADNPPWMAAAGTMHMTLDDLLLYGQIHLDAGQTQDYLLPATFARLHTPILQEYAYGWVVQSRDFGEGEEPVLWHNGSNTMWYALLVLLPERNVAIALATNDGSQLDRTQRSFDELAAQIAKEIVAQTPDAG